jgi:hypothetical protein
MYGSLNTKTGAGVRVTADRPLAYLMLWSIRAVMSVVPVRGVPGQAGRVV